MQVTPFKTGLVSISFRDLPVVEIIEAVRSAGLEGIEWGGDVHVPHGDIRRAKQVGELTREAGLEVAAYGTYYKFEDLKGGEGPSPEAVIETAAALRTRMIRIWPGSTGSAEASPKWVKAVADQTRRMAVLAGAHGMRLGFEFHDHSLTDTPESTLALLRAIGDASVSTFWQPYLKTSEDRRRATLHKVLPYVSNIHVNFFGDHGWPDVQPLDAGRDAWRQYLDTLKTCGAGHWLTIEHVAGHRIGQFLEDAAVLRELAQD